MFPVLIRVFLPISGVKVCVIEFTDLKGEKSSVIFDMLKKVIFENGLEKKLVGFCGDNAPVNFGTYRDRAKKTFSVN